MAIKLDKSKLVRSFRLKLVPHIDRAIEESEEFSWRFDYEPKVGDTAWHPSGDCTQSVYDLWCYAKGQYETRPISANLRKTFMVGHFWHQYLQYIVQEKLAFCDADAIERRGIEVWDGTEKNPIPYHWATGSADIVPCRIPGYGDYLVDFKTMKELDFRRQELPDWAGPKYEAQMNIYMRWFGIEKALIVGINKNSPHDMKEFEFTYNEPLADAIIEKWKLVSAYLDHDLQPSVIDDPYDLPFRGPV